MKFRIAAIGSRPRASFEDLTLLYLDRISALMPGAKSGIEAPFYRTEDALAAALDRERARTAPLVVLLDERGKQMSSESFAQWLGRERDAGRQLIVFAIGPADGWPANHPRADLQLSLGPMTLPHELARVVVCEQIYRALTILSGHPYHREGARNSS
jgi:23S rRNA (pseudouridine1915-N3)-methyltransferase